VRCLCRSWWGVFSCCTLQESHPFPFSSIPRFRQFTFNRGPPGFVLVGGVLAMTAWGFYRWSNEHKERE
jgi:hypothetical protein